MRDQEYDRLLTHLREDDHARAASSSGMTLRHARFNLWTRCLLWLMETVRERSTIAIFWNDGYAGWGCPYDGCNGFAFCRRRRSDRPALVAVEVRRFECKECRRMYVVRFEE